MCAAFVEMYRVGTLACLGFAIDGTVVAATRFNMDTCRSCQHDTKDLCLTTVIVFSFIRPS